MSSTVNLCCAGAQPVFGHLSTHRACAVQGISYSIVAARPRSKRGSMEVYMSATVKVCCAGAQPVPSHHLHR